MSSSLDKGRAVGTATALATFEPRMRAPGRSAWPGILKQTALIVITLIFILPAWGMFATSLKTEAQISKYDTLLGMFWPHPVRLKNYSEVFQFVPYARYLMNTIYVTILAVIGTGFSCSCAAYAFSRLRWPGRNVFFAVLLATMMLPSQVTLMPQFLIFTKLGWVNSFKPLWVPAFFGTAFFIFLLRQFFLTIPKDLEEAAEIDGCSHAGIFWRILLPLLKPALIAILIFQFLNTWNDFVGPLVYINRADMLTMAMGLQMFKVLHLTQWGLMMAAATIMTLPVLVLFFSAQKYFIEGVTLTGIKG
ncbi:MAG: carbohydrate ABC transporter permease [Candidatus Sumerlaeaceae bacterium]